MEFLTSINPATSEALGKVQVSSRNDVDRKVAAANSAKRGWKELGLEGRLRLLKGLYLQVRKQKKILALIATREMGMPIKESVADMESGLEYFKWYLDNAQKILKPETAHRDCISTHQIIYEPIGTTAVIVAWNFPFSNFVWRVIQNLIVGNTVVFKHAEECPLFGKEIENAVRASRLPKGVFSEIYGDGAVGDYLVHKNIDFICFTGSTAVGKRLYKIAADKFIKAHLECGGSAPGIVFSDADIDGILDTIYLDRFLNCGQMCDALKRLLVQKDVMQEVVQKLKQRIKSVKIGNPERKDTTLGPLVSMKQLALLSSQVKDAVARGANVVCGGKILEIERGLYYEPTLLTNITRSMRVWKEEVFGPVLPIMSFNTEEEAVRLGNDTIYGLGAYLFTKDKAKAMRIASRLDTGMVGINNTSYILPSNPFGGYKNSGIGREHGKHGFYDLCQIKVISA
jgi:succinate-semialdehyde dehydrogenase/glutarate-semialdehyde dehydrogenase